MHGRIRLLPGEVGEGHQHLCGCGGPTGLGLLSGPSARSASISAPLEGRAPPEPGPTSIATPDSSLPLGAPSATPAL